MHTAASLGCLAKLVKPHGRARQASQLELFAVPKRKAREGNRRELGLVPKLLRLHIE